LTEAVPPPALEEAGNANIKNGVKAAAAHSTAVVHDPDVTQGQTGDPGSRAVRAPAAPPTTTRLSGSGRKPSSSDNWKRNGSVSESLRNSESGKRRKPREGRKSLNGTNRKR